MGIQIKQTSLEWDYFEIYENVFSLISLCNEPPVNKDAVSALVDFFPFSLMKKEKEVIC